MNKKKATLMVTMICGTLGAQELPLQKEEDRAVLRRQSGMVFDIVSPAALQAGKSTVWIWVGGKRQLCVGTVVGDGTQVLAKWSELSRARGAELQCVAAGNETHTASIVGVYEDEDLALLKLQSGRLRPVVWAAGEKPALGKFLVAAGPGDTPLGMGVVSVMERSLRESDHAFFGVGAESHSEGTGVVIRQIAELSPAETAGLEVEDIILSVNDNRVGGLMEFRAMLAAKKPGESVSVLFSRKGKEKIVKITLASKVGLNSFPQRRLEVMERMGGEISGVRDGFPSVLQTDMVLNPEECGGPVIDLSGNVVGIAAARAGRIRSYVIPAEGIVNMLKKKPVAVELAKVATAEVGPQLSRTRAVRPRLNRPDMDRMRHRMKEMDKLLRQMDEEIQSLNR
jgi:S1-C subfamily serine protease